jgi:hypothetical protein
MNFLFRLLFLFFLVSVHMLAADAKPGHRPPQPMGGRQMGQFPQFVDSDYSKANSATAVTRCIWSPNHIFVVCDQDVNFGGRPMHDLTIYTFDPQTSRFYFYRVSRNEKPRSTALDISENGERWTYSSTADIKDKSVQFRTTNQFHGNDHVEWWSEYSIDGGKNWTKTGSGKESREE